jgi:hypothetical protein
LDGRDEARAVLHSFFKWCNISSMLASKLSHHYDTKLWTTTCRERTWYGPTEVNAGWSYTHDHKTWYLFFNKKTLVVKVCTQPQANIVVAAWWGHCVRLFLWNSSLIHICLDVGLVENDILLGCRGYQI